MSVDHRVELSEEEEAAIAAERRSAVRAVAAARKITVTIGPARPYKSRLYYSGQAAHGFAAGALVAVWAAGGSSVVCLVVAAVTGLAGGVVFHRAPQIWDRLAR